jgi:hypothetical protein
MPITMAGVRMVKRSSYFSTGPTVAQLLIAACLGAAFITAAGSRPAAREYPAEAGK